MEAGSSSASAPTSAAAATTTAAVKTANSASGPLPPSSTSSIFKNILFRNVCPTDLPAIYALERQSYPKDEAASKSQLQYRQHHAAAFFRCAVYIPPPEVKEDDNLLRPNDKEKTDSHAEEKLGENINEEDQQQQEMQQTSSWSLAPTSSKLTEEESGQTVAPMSIPPTDKTSSSTNNKNQDPNSNSLNAIGTIIGFVTATRCHAFTEKSMRVHDPSGNLLAIHSVVIKKEYRNRGIGKAMMENYMQVVEDLMERKWIKDAENKKLVGGGSGSVGVGGTSSLSSSCSSKTQQKTYIQKIVLMSKIANIPFYVKLGFQVLGKSSIVHGGEEWYDCSKQLECAEKVQLQLKEQQQMQRNRNSSLCWIVDSFAIAVGNGSGGRRQRGNSTVGANNVDLAVTNSGSIGAANASGTNASASTAVGNVREGSASTVSLGGGVGTSVSNSAISFAKGSGNPAAVVMVPNATPMSRMKRSSSFNQLQLLGLTETTASTSNSNDASNFDPIFEDNVSWMKHVAKEFNLSETAFIWKRGQLTPSVDVPSSSSSKNTDEVTPNISLTNSSSNAVHYNIRFYTCNGTEIDLCGHATLAASSVIFQRLAKEGMNNNNSSIVGAGRSTNNNSEEIIFHAKNGVTLKAKLSTNNGTAKNNININSGNVGGVGNNETGSSSIIHRNIRPNQQSLKINMEFPTKKVVPFEKGTEKYSEVVTMLKESLYSQSDDSIVEEFIEFVGVDDARDDLLIELTPEGFSNVPRYMEDISLKPMLELRGYNRGVIICCEVSDEYHLYGETADFMSRFFGPKAGIEEDPVTGSAHCILGPYYGTKLGKTTIVGAQKSLRGGIVECQIKSDKVIRIAGAAVTTMSGNLYI